ncbi:MAG TPA: hypothetical protein VGE51_01715 [Fontimonas sp.]
MSSSLSQQLHDQTLNRLVERLSLKEVKGADGGAWLPLISQVPMAQGQIGQVRKFGGGPLSQLISCTIIVPAIGLDSHMLFAFTDTEGAVPHFTVDSVRNGADYAFHLDLIPRLDLAVELAYMDEVFAPLTPQFKAHRELPGLTPAQLDPRQYAVMSPWMLVNRANEAAFTATFDAVGAYLDHWFKVLEAGVSKASLGDTTPAQRATRDAGHRAVLFNPDVDKVWKQIAPLIGADAVEKLIAALRNTRG